MDMKSFYESIGHKRMLEKLTSYINDRFTLNLLWQSMHLCVEHGGLFWDVNHGLPRGCPLSPLLGAFFLTELDEALTERDVFYVRYRDDVLILSKHRWGLRRAVKCLNEILTAHGMEKHPDKTFIGRIEKGFDFLSYHFSRAGLQLAAKTIANAVEKVHPHCGLTDTVAGQGFYGAIEATLIGPGGYAFTEPGTSMSGLGRRYYRFPHDWRQDNSRGAAQLVQLVNQRRLDHRDDSLRVDIVAHSMGGLITR